jgi:hypothetical protein
MGRLGRRLSPMPPRLLRTLRFKLRAERCRIVEGVFGSHCQESSPEEEGREVRGCRNNQNNSFYREAFSIYITHVLITVALTKAQSAFKIWSTNLVPSVSFLRRFGTAFFI